jgi:hypothetical protein
MATAVNESFIVRTARRIRKEAPRKFKELKQIVEDIVGMSVLDGVSDDSNYVIMLLGYFITANAEKDPEYAVSMDQQDIEAFLSPLKQCCESRYPRLMEIGLTAFHFLLGN